MLIQTMQMQDQSPTTVNSVNSVISAREVCTASKTQPIITINVNKLVLSTRPMILRIVILLLKLLQIRDGVLSVLDTEDLQGIAFDVCVK